MGETITFQRPDGKECTGWLERPRSRASGPAGDDAPGVVVIQEWWGLNDQIKNVTSKLAGEGYRALVPDLYRGKVTLDAAEAGHLMGSLDFLDAAQQDVRGAVQHLKRSGGKAGTTGFCMGGVLSILAAIYSKELDAASSWYGVPPPEAGDPSTISIPLQGHFATKDEFFPISSVETLSKTLTDAGVAHEFYRYEAAHAFGNEERPEVHDAAATATAWKRTLEFFEHHLR